MKFSCNNFIHPSLRHRRDTQFRIMAQVYSFAYFRLIALMSVAKAVLELLPSSTIAREKCKQSWPPAYVIAHCTPLLLFRCCCANSLRNNFPDFSRQTGRVYFLISARLTLSLWRLSIRSGNADGQPMACGETKMQH